jgi:hypothetical protein
MKTPEEIKAIKLALMDIETTCGHCPYEGEPNGCNRPGGSCKMFDVALDAAEAISQLEAQQPRWISVGERLPENGQKIIAAFRDGGGLIVDQARYSNGEFDFASWAYVWGDNVTHWMPLPQPPEEERK